MGRGRGLPCSGRARILGSNAVGNLSPWPLGLRAAYSLLGSWRHGRPRAFQARLSPRTRPRPRLPLQLQRRPAQGRQFFSEAKAFRETPAWKKLEQVVSVAVGLGNQAAAKAGEAQHQRIIDARLETPAETARYLADLQSDQGHGRPDRHRGRVHHPSGGRGCGAAAHAAGGEGASRRDVRGQSAAPAAKQGPRFDLCAVPRGDGAPSPGRCPSSGGGRRPTIARERRRRAGRRCCTAGRCASRRRGSGCRRGGPARRCGRCIAARFPDGRASRCRGGCAAAGGTARLRAGGRRLARLPG